MSLKNTGITHPVVIDVVSGEIKAVDWKRGTADRLEMLPVKDSIVAIADESYFDWPVLPEAPSSLKVNLSDDRATLTWDVHGGDPTGVVVERKVSGGEPSHWEKVTTLPVAAKEYTDSGLKEAHSVAYRVHATNSNGSSAYSNIVRITSH